MILFLLEPDRMCIYTVALSHIAADDISLLSDRQKRCFILSCFSESNSIVEKNSLVSLQSCHRVSLSCYAIDVNRPHFIRNGACYYSYCSLSRLHLLLRISSQQQIQKHRRQSNTCERQIKRKCLTHNETSARFSTGPEMVILR